MVCKIYRAGDLHNKPGKLGIFNVSRTHFYDVIEPRLEKACLGDRAVGYTDRSVELVQAEMIAEGGRRCSPTRPYHESSQTNGKLKPQHENSQRTLAHWRWRKIRRAKAWLEHELLIWQRQRLAKRDTHETMTRTSSHSTDS